jgi:hypothetical protein
MNVMCGSTFIGELLHIHFLRFRRQFRHPERVRRRFWPVDSEASSDMLCQQRQQALRDHDHVGRI